MTKKELRAVLEDRQTRVAASKATEISTSFLWLFAKGQPLAESAVQKLFDFVEKTPK